jgi:hypothetical protein
MSFSIAPGEDGTIPATRVEILITPAPRPWGRLLTVAALALVAAVALRAWPQSTTSETEADPIAPTAAAFPPWAPAEAQQMALALSQTNARWNAATVDRPTAYLQFCHNTLSLCDPVTPMPPNPG